MLRSESMPLLRRLPWERTLSPTPPPPSPMAAPPLLLSLRRPRSSRPSAPIRRSSGTRRRHLSEREGNRESKGEAADTPPSLRKRNLSWLRPVNPVVSAGLVGAALGPVDCGYGGYGCRNWQCHRATRQQLTRCFLSAANAAGFVPRDRGRPGVPPRPRARSVQRHPRRLPELYSITRNKLPPGPNNRTHQRAGEPDHWVGGGTASGNKVSGSSPDALQDRKNSAQRGLCSRSNSQS